MFKIIFAIVLFEFFLLVGTNIDMWVVVNIILVLGVLAIGADKIRKGNK